MVKETTTVKRMSYQAFVENAIRKLRNEKSKGIHVVYSKLNAYLTAYYGADIADITETVNLPANEAKGLPARVLSLTGAPAVIQKLIKEGKIDSRPVKGGLMVFIKGEMNTAARTVDIADMKAKLGLK